MIKKGGLTAALFFKSKCATIFDADEEAKRHILSQIDLQNRIIDIFGNQVTRDGCLDLPKLSKYIFSSKQNQDTLNKIIWPEVYTLIKFTAKKAALDDIDLFVVDAALLLEAGYARYFDSILLITAQKSIRIKRIQLRNNIPDDQIEKRMALQMSETNKIKQAQKTIENNGDIKKLYIKLEQFYNNLYFE